MTGAVPHEEPTTSRTPLDPHEISAAVASAADRVRAAAEAGTVPPSSADQLARLLDTIAARLDTAPTEHPEITLDDGDEAAEPPR